MGTKVGTSDKEEQPTSKNERPTSSKKEKTNSNNDQPRDKSGPTSGDKKERTSSNNDKSPSKTDDQSPSKNHKDHKKMPKPKNYPTNVAMQATSQQGFDPVHEEDTQVVHARRDKFINIEALTQTMDLKSLSDIFNSYATKKTFATGFFNLALVATNFAQMKQLIAPPQGRASNWNSLNIVLMTFICLSLVLQFLVAVLLIFLAKQGEFIDEEKRNKLIRSNNGTTLLVLAISIINIFINVFLSI